MVSFDVESLFTNVPVEGTVQATLRKRESDADVVNRTTLTWVQIADLLNFVLKKEQRHGAAMGSPVSAVIAISTWWCLKNKHLASLWSRNAM